MGKQYLKHTIRKYNPGALDYLKKPERVRFARVLELAEPGERLLDIGCYDGSLGVFVSRKLSYKEAWGIEINPKVVRQAREKGMKVIVQDFEERFRFKDDFFDLVIAGEVIEHVADTDFFVQEVKRVLKPNGILILTTPNVASLGRRILLCLGKNPYFEASFTYPPEVKAGHLRFFTRSLLIGFLTRHNFEVKKFSSDVINFDSSGKFSSVFLARIFPTLGRSLIIKAINKG